MTSLTGRHDTTYKGKDTLGSEVKNTQGSKEGLFFRLFTTSVKCALGISDDIVTSDDVTSLYQSLTGTWGRHDDDVTGGEETLGRHNNDVKGRGGALERHDDDVTHGREPFGDDITLGAEALGHYNDDVTGGAEGENRGPEVAQEEVQLSQRECSLYQPQEEEPREDEEDKGRPRECQDDLERSTSGIASTQNVPCADDIRKEPPYLPDGCGNGTGSGSAHVDEDLVIDGPDGDVGPAFLVNHQYPDQNGGFTTINVRVQKMVVGAGTSFQIGSGNSCFQGNQGGD